MKSDNKISYDILGWLFIIVVMAIIAESIKL